MLGQRAGNSPQRFVNVVSGLALIAQSRRRLNNHEVDPKLIFSIGRSL